MKSERNKPLKLSVNSETSNQIVISNTLKPKTPAPSFIKLRYNYSSHHSDITVNNVIYPVSFANVDKSHILIPSEIRKDLKFNLNEKIDCCLEENINAPVITSVYCIIEKMHGGLLHHVEIDAESFHAAIRGQSHLHVGQILIIPMQGIRLQIRVDRLHVQLSNILEQDVEFGQIGDLTHINLINHQAHYFKLINEYIPEMETTSQLSGIPLDFTSLGIGGLKNEVSQIIRTLFYSRIINPELAKAYGLTNRHAKGILLAGLPGTGKSMLAAKLGELFVKENVRVIHGPELKNSYYGQTQQNLANIFNHAINNPKQLYVYIFEEIDALFPSRSNNDSVSSANNNDLVARFLPILDGPNALKNIIVIGTTNRKELIDEALLRPGRFDAVIDIGLPDEKARLEILQCHLRKLDNIILQPDIDLLEIAKLTKYFTGAELVLLLKNAIDYAVEKDLTTENNYLIQRKDIINLQQAEKLSQNYLLKAFKEIRPAYGPHLVNNKSEIFIEYSPSIISIKNRFMKLKNSLLISKYLQQTNILIYGDIGTGKSYLARHLAKQDESFQVYIITPRESIINLIECFARAKQAKEPIILVIDGLEHFLNTDIQTQHKLIELLGDYQNQNKVLVIATTQQRHLLQKTGVAQLFQESIALTPIKLDLQTLQNICVAFNYKLVGSMVNIEVEIGIRELIYKIHAFCARQENLNTLHINEFLYDFTSANSTPTPSRGALFATK